MFTEPCIDLYDADAFRSDSISANGFPFPFVIGFWYLYSIVVVAVVVVGFGCGKRKQKKIGHIKCAFVSFVSTVMSSSTSIPFKQNSYCNNATYLSIHRPPPPKHNGEKFHFQFQINGSDKYFQIVNNYCQLVDAKWVFQVCWWCFPQNNFLFKSVIFLFSATPTLCRWKLLIDAFRLLSLSPVKFLIFMMQNNVSTRGQILKYCCRKWIA